MVVVIYDYYCDDCFCVGICYEFVGLDLEFWCCFCYYGGFVCVVVFDDWLGWGGDYRFGYVVKCFVWDVVGDCC